MEFVVTDVQHGKNDRHPPERWQHRPGVTEDRSEDLQNPFSLGNQHQCRNGITKSYDPQNNFHYKPIDRKERRTDEMARLPVMSGHEHWMTVLFEDGRRLIFIQWTSEFSLFVFHLRAEILSKFFEDVVLLRLRQVRPYRLQVTPEKIHTVLLNDPFQRRIHALPFLEQLLEDVRAVLREPVKPLVALVFLAPLALQ